MRSGLKNSYAHTLIIGPSYIRNKKTKAWGIHSAFRSESSISNLSPELAILLNNQFPQLLYGTRFTSNKTTAAYASWVEIGGTYGKVFRESENHLIKWAGNLNALVGLNGYYYNQKNLEYTPIDSSQSLVHKMDATFAHTLGRSFFDLRGFGLSTTLGVTYINRPQRGSFECNMSNDREKKYNYRLGFSILDLGLIRYINQSQIVNVKTESDVVWNGLDSLHIGSLSTLDNALLGNIGGTVENKDFNIWLPFALSMQFDYQIIANLFANASVVKRIQFAENQIARGDQVNISVRYERRRYEAAANLTFYEFKDPSLGLGLRYRFFVIGSDRLLQLLGVNDANSFDFFFGLKFQFCKKPFSPGPDCPAFFN
jgi:hypothetical protein